MIGRSGSGLFAAVFRWCPSPLPGRLARAAAAPAVLAAATLAGCGDSPSGLLDPPAGDRGAGAAVVSETVFRDGRDGGGLPPWENVFAAMDAPGCVAHFRKVDGSCVAREYRLRYRGAGQIIVADE